MDRRVLRRRRKIALAFDTVLRDVVGRADSFTARAPVAGSQVLAAQTEIEQLVAHLRDVDRRVDANALLLAEELLCDTEGALFVERPERGLSARVRFVRIALE